MTGSTGKTPPETQKTVLILALHRAREAEREDQQNGPSDRGHNGR